MMPVSAAADERLGKNEYKVLIALLAHADKAGKCHPRRSTIAKMTCLPETRISTITTKLQKLGWVKKEGHGGKSQAARYVITEPITVTESVTLSSGDTVTETVTVTNPVTVTESVTGGVTETVTNGVTETVTGKEQTIEQTSEQKKNKGSIDYSCLPEEIEKETAKEFVEHRKLVKKPLTQNGFERQMNAAVKTGADLTIDPNLAIQETIDAGWQGIKTDWLGKRLNQAGKRSVGQGPNRQEALELRNREVGKRAAEKIRKMEAQNARA